MHEEEEEKSSVILTPDAVVHPHTVVIKSLHAHVAELAVLRSGGLDDAACEAAVFGEIQYVVKCILLILGRVGSHVAGALPACIHK
jgi:hypothetical protein